MSATDSNTTFDNAAHGGCSAVSCSGSGSLKPFTHVNLDRYTFGACAEKKAVLIAQDKEAREENSITCGCGWKRWIAYAYRCLYCGEWYCAPCAETHFGQSINDWTMEKRIAARLEAQARIKTNRPANHERNTTITRIPL